MILTTITVSRCPFLHFPVLSFFSSFLYLKQVCLHSAAVCTTQGQLSAWLVWPTTTHYFCIIMGIRDKKEIEMCTVQASKRLHLHLPIVSWVKSVRMCCECHHVCSGSNTEKYVSLCWMSGVLVQVLTGGWSCTGKPKLLQPVVNEVCSWHWHH